MGIENEQVSSGEGTGSSDSDGANGAGTQAPDGLDIAVAVESIGSDLFGEPEKPKGGKEAAASEVRVEEGADPLKPADPAKPAIDPKTGLPVPPEGTAKPAFTPPPEHAHLFNEQGELRTWRKEAAAQFSSLPPDIQAEILKREEDIFTGIEGYKADAAFGKDFQKVLAPYMPVFEQYRVDPRAQVGELLKYQYGFAFGTDQDKAALIQQLAKDYRIDLAAVAASAPYSDPQVTALQNQITELKSRLTARDQTEAEGRRAGLQSEITAFLSDPKNVYAQELVNDMAHLLKTGAESTLKGAYEKAMWSNPSVRAKELARQQAEKDAAMKAAADAKAEEARKATAANIRSRTKGGGAAAPLGSIDDTLKETLAGIRGRH